MEIRISRILQKTNRKIIHRGGYPEMQNPDVDWGMYFKYRIGIFDERQKMPDTTKDFIGDGGILIGKKISSIF